MENILRCLMCSVMCVSNDDLIRHIVRYHRLDPRFQVQCKHDGCGATFHKWKSFRQHIWRNHGNDGPADGENFERDIYFPDVDHNMRGEDDYQNDDAGCDEPVMTGLEQLQWHAAKFLLDIRENCRISQTAVERVIDGVQHLVSTYSSIIMDKLRQSMDADTQLIHFDVIKQYLTETYPPSTLFLPVRTKERFDQFLVKKFNMVPPQEHVIYKDLGWLRNKHGVLDLQEIERYAYIVPFLDNLKLLLNNDEVRHGIENPKEHQNGTYKTVLDGSVYREEEFFRSHPNPLAIILYYDDLGVANPLGVSSKAQKLSIFYWTLGNIHPEDRSTRNAIQLLAITKTEWLKKDGALAKLLEPFIQDMIKLRTEGVTMNTGEGGAKVFKGSLLFCSADTPAAALMGGFKESVSAYRLCRHCMITKNDWKNVFSEEKLILRNKRDHAQHIAAINEPNVPNQVSAFWKRRYGVNSKSPLLDIPDLDATVCLPQDAMHVLIEGLVELANRKLLHYLIFEREIFTLDDLNKWRTNFNYYGPFKRDMPAVILREHLTSADGKLRQTAAQMFTLAHILPFFIASSIMDEEDPDICARLSLHTHLLNMCLAYEIHDESVDFLSHMIELYMRRFVLLYPNCAIPKMHFLLHIRQCIRLFGPARQQWCFRFESAHAYFKTLVPVVRNFKNMAYTCAFRHQANLCSKLATYPGTRSPKFLYQGHEISPGDTVLLDNLPNCRLFRQYIIEAEINNCQLLRTPKVKIHGTIYVPKSLRLLQSEEDFLPVFGEVNEIFVIKVVLYLSSVSDGCQARALRKIASSRKLNLYES